MALNPSDTIRPASDVTPNAGILSSRARPVAPEVACDILLTHYGIVGRASALVGERDHNFLVRATGGERYILKVSHPDESLEAVRFQSGALAHIATVDPTVRVPSLVPDRHGAHEFTVDADGTVRIVRLLSYLDGTLLHLTPPSGAQDRHLGAFLARLGLALKDYRQAGTGDELLWDLRSLPRSRYLLAWIADPALRSLVEPVYDDFERHVTPSLGRLRSQAIHNDMNPYNVLVESQDAAAVAGIIDFGDMVHGPLAGDIAVGACYRWTLREHPLAGAARFLQGFVAVREIHEDELRVMFDLLRARLALTLTIANWQSLQFPDSRDYVLRLQRELQAALRHVSQITRDDAYVYLQRAGLSA